MYYIIYETINLVNGKRYIGKHKTEIINDGYLGSGLALNRAIKKYGKENFKREILCFCESEKELNDKEKELVTREISDSTEYYNLRTGGDGAHNLKK